MLPVQPVTVRVYVFHIAGVYSTSCWLGDLLSGTDTQNRPFGIQNIQFANPVGCAGWCNSQWKIEVGGFFVVQTATKLSGNEVYIYYIYISICILKKFISSISTSGTVSHMNIIVVHAKGQHWSNSKTSLHATRKVLWPPTTSVKTMQKTIYVDVHLYICCRLGIINNEYNANTVCI